MFSSIFKLIGLSFSLLLLLTSCSIIKNERAVKKPARQTLLRDKDLSSALIGIALYDLDEDVYVYKYQGDKNFIPASITKLFTCYAAMKYLGDSIATFNYFIRKDSSVVIQPLADPTFLNPDFKKQRGYSFLKKFKSIRLSQYDDTAIPRLGSGWAWEDYIYYYSTQQNLFPIYGNLATLTKNGDRAITIQPSYFKKNLRISGSLDQGFGVTKEWDRNAFSVTPGKSTEEQIPFIPDVSTIANLLADTLHKSVILDNNMFDRNRASTLYTQSTNDMLQKMMYNSDNFIAEQALLMVGIKKWNTTNVQVIIDTLLKTDFKELPQVPRLVDGSGLSRYNLCTPNNFIYLLRSMKKEFSWDRITTVLPTGGQGKQLNSYYQDYANRIYAKTGTVSNNFSISGYLITQRGKKLAFAISINHHTAKGALVRKRVERFLTHVIDNY